MVLSQRIYAALQQAPEPTLIRLRQSPNRTKPAARTTLLFLIPVNLPRLDQLVVVVRRAISRDDGAFFSVDEITS